ncbi:exodeoxyribonuclease III [Desulfosporosinus acidiphilus SJ4]|uniref:Exodeoxyribonuclease III n=1 Tax=Desulfosporosinus acidiphilus (strain DSM 22704 / JCM 16185 / SJ4) TaxID=646529 RepID=I4D481_DESAJ|nr:exodeoxyribonuclease III [Desulfosporosinus acidiphilus]AFM40605.1 exodeoxyribonuclease III [Desulfosporosinus acidiphilus SJ4]
MKLISWNVNGFRSCLTKGFLDFFNTVEADIFCIQESKLSAGQIELSLEGYTQYFNYAERKGYSGTAVFTKKQPLTCSFGMGIPLHDKEGRMITLEYDEFYLINLYAPNSQAELARLEYRLTWEEDFRRYVQTLNSHKPVIFCGDLNVAHQEIDLKNPQANRRNAGFTDEERLKFSELLESGFIDTFRYLYPEQKDSYSWWSYRFNARVRNAGWRIDYFCMSERLKDSLQSAEIYTSVLGSDHCPVGIEVNSFS